MAVERHGAGSKLRDGLITILTVWLVLSLAGAAGSLVPGRGASALTASALFVVLLSPYSVWAAPGRQTSTSVYMAAGVALLPLSFGLLLLLDRTDRYDLSWLFIGGHVGYMPRAIDSGMAVAWFIWWLSVLVLIYLSLVPRKALAGDQDADRSVEGDSKP